MTDEDHPASPRRHWLYDRTPIRRDWRWAIGWVGKVLIVIGLLLFAFVGYQLWGTGIQTAQAQNRLEDEFERLTGQATTTTAPSAATTTPATTAPPSPGSDPVTTSAAPATTTTVAAPVIVGPDIGDPIARLEIPDIDVDVIVVSGVGVQELREGVGHFPESRLPGQLGNAAFAGHRTTYGAPFIDVDDLEPGDRMVVTGAFGQRFVYAVTDTEIVGPGDYALVVPTDDESVATLTLSSCHPKRSSSQRIIVRSELVVEESSPIAGPTPEQAASTSTLPATTVPATTTETSDPTSSSTSTASPPSTSTATTTPSTALPGELTPPPLDPGGPGAQDAFGVGWFDDGAAWPHIVAWGLLLAFVGFGAARLARATRRVWLGALGGIAPFVVILYFWFQNINRLLPPGL